MARWTRHTPAAAQAAAAAAHGDGAPPPQAGTGAGADSGSDSDDEQTWVSCDACNKWRRVLDSQSLRSARRWRCSDNRDPRYASCATPQELPDERIDELLGLTRKRRERKKRKHEAGAARL